MNIPILSRWVERRSSLSNPSRWLIDYFQGRETASGKRVNENNALTLTAYYSGVRLLAETLASVPLPLYERLQPRGKRRAPNHPLYPVLHDIANPEMTSFALRETMQAHLVSWGNAYAEIQRNGAGDVIALWPLRPDRTTPKREKGILRYEYDLPDGTRKVLPQEKVLHIAGLGFDGLKGYSPVRLAREALGLGLATEEFGAKFFSNGAAPSGIVEYPGKLKPPALEEFKKSVHSAYGGLSNAHRLMVLEEGLKYHQVGIPPEDAQFLETRKFQVTEVARLLRLPPHMLADLDRATFSNIEQQSLEYVIYSARPWFVRWEQTIALKLLTPAERKRYFAEFLADGLLRGNIKDRYDAYAVGRQNGWLSANDIRELENQNPVEGGDVYLVPLNMVPADQVSSGTADATGDPEPRTQRSTAEDRGLRSARSRRLIRTAHRRVIADTEARVVRRERADIRKLAQKHLTRRDAGLFVADLEDFYQQHIEFTERQYLPVILALADAIHAEAANEIGQPTELTPEMERFARDYVTTLAIRHVASARGQLRQLAADMPADELLAAIEQRLTEWVDRRPDKAALRESVTADGAFARETYRQAGVRQLRWVAFGTNCAYCNHLDGRTVGIEQNFLAAGESIHPDGVDEPLTPTSNIGHPQAHGGCDCSVVAG